jgi:hypothetical protein
VELATYRISSIHGSEFGNRVLGKLNLRKEEIKAIKRLNCIHDLVGLSPAPRRQLSRSICALHHSILANLWVASLIIHDHFILKSYWIHYSYVRLPFGQDNSVGITTGYGLDDRGVVVWVPVGSRIFSSSRRPDRFWGPGNLLSNGVSGDLSWEVKRPGREADHSPPASAEVK